MADRSIPFAQANTITQMGKEAQFTAQQDLPDRYTIRNKWTAGSIRSTRATPRRLESRVGSLREYMADQEEGSNRRKNTGLPTAFASGENPQARSGPRKRAVRPGMRKNKMSAIKPMPYQGVSGQQTAFVQAKLALQAGQRFAFIQVGSESVGIYRVQWKGRSKSGRKGIKMRMVYDLSNRAIKTKKKPWLSPAMRQTIPKGQKIFNSFARQELARRGLLK